MAGCSCCGGGSSFDRHYCECVQGFGSDPRIVNDACYRYAVNAMNSEEDGSEVDDGPDLRNLVWVLTAGAVLIAIATGMEPFPSIIRSLQEALQGATAGR
jgi:hypothetical protein